MGLLLGGVESAAFKSVSNAGAVSMVMVENDCDLQSRNPQESIRYKWAAIVSNFYQGRAVVSPYVGMVRKQDGGSKGCISNYIMAIT